MTQIERMLNRCQNDIAKAQKGIVRCSKYNEKKEAKCIKLNCLWTTFEEFVRHRDSDMTNEQYAAYFDWHRNQNDIKEYEHNLERARKEYDKLMKKYTSESEEQALTHHINGIEGSWVQLVDRQEKQERYFRWLEQFKAECLKDGITIKEATNNYISGLSKKGEKFVMYINNGWTERSIHSYTLRIAGETIFTSGLFSTGYRYLMR